MNTTENCIEQFYGGGFSRGQWRRQNDFINDISKME